MAAGFGKLSRLAWAVVLAVFLAVPCVGQGEPKVVLVAGQPMYDAVRSLGCQMGPGITGNAQKINAHLLTKPAYPLFIPGGYFAITEPIVIPAYEGVGVIQGNGLTAILSDPQYSGPLGIGGNPTRIVWEGNDTDPMIQHNGVYLIIRDLTFQGRPVPLAEQQPPTRTMARLGIHVRTQAQTTRPTGKLYIQNIGFWQIGTHLLFGQDLDSPIASIYEQDNSDESFWIGTAHYFSYGAGAGSGMLAAGSGNTNRVITLGTLPIHTYGITVGAPVDVVWTGGTRRNLRVTAVSGAQGETITLGGGNGDNLPSAQTAVTATEERVCFRFRTQQALDFTGNRSMVWGDARDVFWFESGSRLMQQHLSMVPYTYGRLNNVATNVLRTGTKANWAAYDISLTMDSHATNVRLLDMDAPVLGGTAVFRGFQILAASTGDEPPGGGTYAVPLVRARGGMTVRLENFNQIRPGAIQLLGDDLANQQGRIAACHLEHCLFSPHFHVGPYAAPDGGYAEDLLHPDSTGPYWLTWRDCANWSVGPTSGAESDGKYITWPYEDGEVLDVPAKLPGKRPPPP